MEKLKNYEGYYINKNLEIFGKRGFKLTPCLKPTGYLQIRFKINNKQITKQLHRVIAEHFIPNPNPEEFTEIHHINHNRSDNRIENLCWISKSDNLRATQNRKGYWWNNKRKKYVAQIRIDKKKNPKILGRFNMECEARAKYIEAYNEIMKKYNNEKLLIKY
tara:strand:- start:1882 stop:2367 length:486 start_codon:yes stop_codon:yes gene_type:complete